MRWGKTSNLVEVELYGTSKENKRAFFNTVSWKSLGAVASIACIIYWMYWLGPLIHLAFLIHWKWRWMLGKIYLQFWFRVAIKILHFVTFLTFSFLVATLCWSISTSFFFFFFLQGGIFPHSTSCPVIASHSYYLLFCEISSSLSYFLFFFPVISVVQMTFLCWCFSSDLLL